MRRGTMRAVQCATIAAVVGIVAATGCGPSGPPSLHQFTLTYDFTISPDEAPPRARDDIHYTIRVLDRKTRQPIENGEGQLFAGKPITRKRRRVRRRRRMTRSPTARKLAPTTPK